MSIPTPEQAFAALRRGGLIPGSAKPEDVEARLKQLTGATDLPGLLDLAQPHVADAVASIGLVVEAETVDTVQSVLPRLPARRVDSTFGTALTDSHGSERLL